MFFLVCAACRSKAGGSRPGSVPLRIVIAVGTGASALSGSVWDEVLDTEQTTVRRTYIEQWPRKDRGPEKVLIIVVEADEAHRFLCPECGQRGKPVEWDVKRRYARSPWMCTVSARSWKRTCPGSSARGTARSPRRCRGPRRDDRFSRPFEE